MDFLNPIPCKKCIILPICIGKYRNLFEMSLEKSVTKSTIFCGVFALGVMTNNCKELKTYVERKTSDLESSPIVSSIRFLNKTSGLKKNEKGRLYKKVFRLLNLRKN